MALLLTWLFSLMTSVVVSVICTEDFTYRGNNLNLESVPNDDIPLNVTKIYLNTNKITTDNFSLSNFSFLEKLILSRNRLSEFPDLVNVSSTLKELSLEYNKIEHISPDLLNQLDVIKVIKMYGNPLSSIPDVSGPSHTLTKISIGGIKCKMSHLPVLPNLGKSITNFVPYHMDNFVITFESIASFPNMTYLTVSYSKNLQIQDSCFLNRTHKLTIYAKRASFVCDEHAWWLKMADKTGLVSVTGNPSVCDQTWDSFETAEHYKTGYDQILYKPMVRPFLCPLKITSVHADTPPGACALRCHLSSSCFMFATDGGNCALTGADVGSMEALTTYKTWWKLNKY